MAAGKRYKWQGSMVEWGTEFAPASPAVTITAITNADPMVITATNTFDEGDVVRATGVVGMTELNDRIGIVTNPSGTNLEIYGIDSTDYAAYVSGGTIEVLTFVNWCELTAYNRTGGTTAEIDASTICSTAVENEPGLQDFGTAALDYNFAPQTVVQESIQDHANTGEHSAIRVTLPGDGGIRTIEGWVQQTSEQSGNGQIWKGNMAFRVTGQPFDQEAAEMENGKFDRLLDTTEALLAACKERGIYAATPRKLFIPVFGHVHVRRITIGEIDDQMDDPPNADKKWRAARNATRLLCNEQGKRLFDPNNAEHVQAMAEMDLDVLTAISETTRKEDTAEGN